MKLRELLSEGLWNTVFSPAKLAKLISDPDKGIKAANKLRSKYSDQLTDLGHNELLPIQGHTQIRDLQKNLTKGIDQVGVVVNPYYQTNKVSSYGSAIDIARKRDALLLARREAERAGASKEHLAKLDLGIADANKATDDAINLTTDNRFKYANDFQRWAARNQSARKSLAKRKSKMTPEELRARQDKINVQQRTLKAEKRANMSPEELAADIAKDSARTTANLDIMKASLTPDELATWTTNNNARRSANLAKKKANMTPEELRARQDKINVQSNAAKAKKRAERMEKDPVYAARVRENERRANLTPDELAAERTAAKARKNARRIKSNAKRRANMTPEELVAANARKNASTRKSKAKTKSERTPEEQREWQDKRNTQQNTDYAKKKAERMEKDPVYAARVREKERIASLTPAERKAADNTRHYENLAKRKSKMTPEELRAQKDKRNAARSEFEAKKKAEKMKNDPVYAARVREKERRANLKPSERKAEDHTKRMAAQRERRKLNKNKKK